MILCINANASIDKTVIVNSFRLNEIHRPKQVLAIPGGKGCNVARALHCLGDVPVVSGWVGGYAGQFIEDGLHREGIRTDFVYADFESRTCLSILDPAANTLTEIYERGDPVSADKIEEFKARFLGNLDGYEAITLSGSLPPGVPTDFYSDLIKIAHAAGIPAILDASGEALISGIKAQPRLVKPNKNEFVDLAGSKASTVADYAKAVPAVSQHYQTPIVLSLGADGAVATDGSEVWHVYPPSLTITSAVGSGDCMMAGITYGLTHDFKFDEAIRYGVAAGTANALTVGAGKFTLDDFDRVLAGVTLTRL